MQHNAHCYAFWNAPLSQRKAFAQSLLNAINTKLKTGGYSSADGYYEDKHRALKIRAEMENKHAYQVDPMGYWFGHQSN